MAISNFVEFLMLTLLLLLAAKILIFCVLSGTHHKTSKGKTRRNKGIHYNPPVSIIVPAYNEELTVKNCVQSLLKQSYKNCEIILVDDGSTDTTRMVCAGLAASYPRNITFYTKNNGGKASALNYGIRNSRGDIIVSIDADSLFVTDTVKHLVESFKDPRVGAVGGNVKVANRANLLSKQQAAEYISGLTIQRKAFAQINCMQIISGAIGAFRKEALMKVGGYSSDTLVEDMDITISIAKIGYKVEYNAEAIAYTEAPETIADFLKQRVRWIFGGFQILKKHNDMIFNAQYGKMGMIALPYFMIFPWIDVLISFLFVFTVLRTIFLGKLLEFIPFYILMATIQATIMLYALVMDKEDKRLLWLSSIDSLWYNHLIAFATLKAATKYVFGITQSWNKLERLGKNLIPTG
ncbi:glycosyltransferase family 2 protein [Patescibacteria group bacterium]|nr:glycosyltransferase family 2 protein [Patescibacteria group bacterium]